MPSTTLYLIRHGEADEPGGSADPALTDRGVLQSLAVAERLSLTGVDAILHSSKRRAAETARLIGKHLTLRPEPSPLLDDRTPIPDDWSEVPDRYHTFLRSAPADERDTGGRRLDAAFADLGSITAGDRRIVAVTHNFVIGWFVRCVLDAPWWRWIDLNQANCGISIVEWTSDGPPHLRGFNDVGHLGGTVK